MYINKITQKSKKSAVFLLYSSKKSKPDPVFLIK